jgi:iron-sulfur cluster assembly protein
MFRLTDAAAEQILRAAEIQDDEPNLRIAAKVDEADGEIVYGMGFDEEREHDLTLDCAGVRILIAPRSQPLLENTVLDFVELKPGEFQFVFGEDDDAPPANCGGGGCGGCGAGGGVGGG